MGSRNYLQKNALIRETLHVIFILLLAISDGVRSTTSEVTSAELPEMRTNCGTLPSTIHVTKEEYNDQGKVVRSCEGTVAVNKCEGTCVSQVQPSVVTPTGFLKDCQCCRESWMRQKEVKLNECYDAEGQKLRDKEGMMYIQIQEPEECSCHKCGT